MRTSGGRVLLQRPVRPVRVVMIAVLAEDQPQVAFAGDQRPGPGTPGVRWQSIAPRSRSPGSPDRCLDDPHARRSEHGIERRGELGVPVTDQEFTPSAWPSRFISRLRAWL
jgi:hypothetical protein